jgi:hypothetical protein
VVCVLLGRRLPRRLALQPVDVDPDAADALLEAQQGDAGAGDVKDVQARVPAVLCHALLLYCRVGTPWGMVGSSHWQPLQMQANADAARLSIALRQCEYV